jgi:hypothetical protein
MQDWHLLCKCEGPTPPRDPAADLAAVGLGGTWARMGGDCGGRRVTVGGGINRIIPLDLGGWAGSIGRVRGMPEVWPLALGSFAVGDGPRAVD